AARQARYYILVVLFTALILLEFLRYFQDPERARRWSFYLRLGLYGLGVYLANYVSFGGLWVSLTIFVLFTQDHALIRRFLFLSALLALPMAGEFLMVHSEYVAGSPAAQPARLRGYLMVMGWHWEELFRLIPRAAIVPAAWYVFFRCRQRGLLAWMALLCTSIVLGSILTTILVAKTGAIPRYYFQILPAILLATMILLERL